MTDARGNAFVNVIFSNGPYDCGPCLVMDLFTEKGMRLTYESKNLDKTIASNKLINLPSSTISLYRK